MTSFSNLKKSKQTNKISISLMIALLAIAVSVFTGCGGDSGSNNNNPQPTPAPTYSVSFITNGGSAVTARSIQQGGVITTSPETTRAGFVFDGWFTDNNTFANKVSFPYTPTGNITLYAKWTQLAGTYTVTFETNGGSYLATLNNVSSIETEPHTSRSGYNFDGWFTAANFSGGRITFPYTLTQNTTLYAKWTQATATYTVTFATNGGSYLANLNNVSSIATEPLTTRAGYNFDGWFTSSNFLDARITFPYTVTEDITLYAKWTQATATYTVTFITNGGSSVATLNNVTSISAEPLTTRSGYDFDGWFTAANFSGVRITFPYTVTQNITLYAKWTAAETWIEIWTPADLSNIRNGLAGNYRLMANISLASSNWSQLGSNGDPFTGKIDGNGYKITNLRIERPTEDYVGLFGYVSGGTITNLALENVSITGNSYIGAIAGYVINSTITDSYSTGDIAAFSSFIGVSTASSICSGGIAGAIQNSTITNSYSTGDISSSFSFTPPYSSHGSVFSGGIAGHVLNGTINGSYSTGNVSASAGTLDFARAGGIAGAGGTITNSYSTGNVSVSGADWIYSGGIVGSTDGTITNSYSTGNISAHGNISLIVRVGGIAGSLSGTITSSYSTGIISVGGSSSLNRVRVGGIAGEMEDGALIVNSKEQFINNMNKW